MKYIDAEKLKEEIEHLKQPFKKDIEDGVYPTYLCALLDFEELITSLQQEQPEVDLDREVKSWIRNHVKGDDFEPYRTIKKKVIEWGEFVAHHFYKLGLNARKEENK